MAAKKAIFGTLLHVVTKHVSCKCECNFDNKKCYSNQKWNNDKCLCECKNPKEHRLCEKTYIWNPATCNSKNGKYVGSIIDHSVVTCDDFIEETKLFRQSNSTKVILTKCTSTNSYILLAFLLIAIAYW